MLSPRNTSISSFNFNTPGEGRQEKERTQDEDIVELKKGLGMHSAESTMWTASAFITSLLASMRDADRRVAIQYRP